MFAEELVIYSFITSGDAPGGNSFFKYVPIEYKEKIGYNEFIREQLYNMRNADSFLEVTADDLFRNNWFNEELVKPIKVSEYNSAFDPIEGSDTYFNNTLKSLMSSEGLGFKNTKYPIAFIGKRLDGAKMAPIRVDIVDGNVRNTYPPYIKMRFYNGNAKDNSIIYKLDRYVGGDNNTPLYKVITKLGYKKDGLTLVEYGKCKFNTRV